MVHDTHLQLLCLRCHQGSSWWLFTSGWDSYSSTTQHLWVGWFAYYEVYQEMCQACELTYLCQQLWTQFPHSVYWGVTLEEGVVIYALTCGVTDSLLLLFPSPLPLSSIHNIPGILWEMRSPIHLWWSTDWMKRHEWHVHTDTHLVLPQFS